MENIVISQDIIHISGYKFKEHWKIPETNGFNDEVFLDIIRILGYKFKESWINPKKY